MSQGYPTIKINGKHTDLHRWYYQKEKNIDLTGLEVMHLCDNRSCININHLTHGTNKDNTWDMISKERNFTVIKKKDALYIAELYEKGYSRKQISKITNIRVNIIQNVLNGKTWGYVTNIKYKYHKRVDMQSNIPNIYWENNLQKWRVVVAKNGKRYRSKRFDSISDAINAKEQLINMLKVV